MRADVAVTIIELYALAVTFWGVLILLVRGWARRTHRPTPVAAAQARHPSNRPVDRGCPCGNCDTLREIVTLELAYRAPAAGEAA